MSSIHTLDDLAASFQEHQDRLLALAQKNLPPVLLRRMAHEDVLQEAWLAAAKRLSYFADNPEVPSYFKWRTVLLQTITDLTRKHLSANSRSANHEVNFDAMPDASDGMQEVAAAGPSPASIVANAERTELLRAALASLPENDRRIIVLRNFDGMGNTEAANALGIEPKAASIRYVRALERLKKKLLELTIFRNP